MKTPKNTFDLFTPIDFIQNQPIDLNLTYTTAQNVMDIITIDNPLIKDFYEAFDKVYELYVGSDPNNENNLWDIGVMTGLSAAHIKAWHNKTAAPPLDQIQKVTAFLVKLEKLKGTIIFTDRGCPGISSLEAGIL